MPANYVSVSEDNFQSGIDQLSPEGSIPPSYVEDALNTDAGAQKHLAKRKGYASLGSLPFRITRIKQTSSPSELCFYLDSGVGTSAVNLAQVRPSPIIVQGQSLAGVGDFTFGSDTVRYYDSFTVDVRLLFPPSSTTTQVLVAEAHGQSTANLFSTSATSESAVEINQDNSITIPDNITIDTGTFNVSYTAANGSPNNLYKYAYVLNNNTVAGATYVDTLVAPASSTTHSITTATHALANQDILVQCWRVDGTTRTLFIPDNITLSNGNVSITWTGLHDPIAPSEVVTLLRSVPETRTKEGTAAALNNTTVQLENLTSNFLVVQTLVDSSHGIWEVVIPESIVIDSETQTATVTFINNVSTSSARFRVLWEEAEVTTNKLCVTPATTADYDSLSDAGKLQLTLWGLSHEEIYKDRDSTRAGWVTALDSYRSQGEGYLATTLGWNLFREAFRTSQDGTAYRMPLRWVNLRQRAELTSYIAPLFHGLSDTILRTRGGVKIPGGEEGWANILSVSYSGTPGLVDVVVSTPGTSVGEISSGEVQPELTSTAGDLLTLRYSVYAPLDGEFSIISFNDSVADQLTFRIRVPDIQSSDYDFVGQGQAGVFTDRLSFNLSSTSNTETTKVTVPLVGDILNATSFSEGTTLEVKSVVSGSTFTNNVFVGPCKNTEVLPGGQLVTLSRTTNVVTLRDLDPQTTITVEDYVKQDVLTFSDRAHTFQIKHIIKTRQAIAVEVNAEGTVITCLSYGPAVPSLNIGQVILISKIGALSGEWRVTGISTIDTFTAEPVREQIAQRLLQHPGASIVGELVEGQIELNLEDTFTDNDNSTVTASVDTRFVPVENPQVTLSTLPSFVKLRPKHLEAGSYTEQSLVKTTLSADSLYLTNGVDPVLRFDGANILQAGLPRWQPGLFVMRSGTSGIAVQSKNVQIASVSGASISPTNNNETARFVVGQSVIFRDASFNELSRNTVTGISNHNVFFEAAVPAAAAWVSLGQEQVFKYYFRLSALDRNGRILLTYAAQSEDFDLTLQSSATVRLRLVGLPLFPQLDYDRVKLEVYRTKAGGLAPYFRIATLQLQASEYPTYEAGKGRGIAGYIDLDDSTSDLGLTDVDQDAILQNISGGLTPPVALEQPPFAKLVTSIGNTVAYGNIQRVPRITLDLVPTLGPLVVQGERWVLRRNSTDTAISTDLQAGRVGLEFQLSANTETTTGVPSITTNTFTLPVATGGATKYPVGSWVYLTHGTDKVDKDQRLCGWWQVQAVTDTSVSFRYDGISGAGTAADVDFVVRTTTPAAGLVPVWLGTDYSLQTRSGQQAAGTTQADVPRSLQLLVRRASLALQALSGTRTINTQGPWYAAQGGNDLPGGRLLVDFPYPLTTTPSLTLGVAPTLATPRGYEAFGNERTVALTGSILAESLRLPSRVVFSYENFPGLVGNAFAVDPVSISGTSSLSTAVDVNPSDGQEITAIVPFFSESAYGEANQGATLLVFKTDSIYLVRPPVAGRAGQAQRIESQGIGCSAPGSVAVTRQGIIWAHNSGLYRIGRNNTVEPVGAKLQRQFKDLVNNSTEALEVAQAHNLAQERRYRFFFSRPGAASLRLTDGFTFDYTPESLGTGPGAWARLDNHPVTNFCNLFGQSFFGTSGGQIQKLSLAEDKWSYHDNGSAYVMRVDFRALNFGDPSIRKRLLHMVANFRLPRDEAGLAETLTSVQMSEAVDLSSSFQALDAAVLRASSSRDGLSSQAVSKQSQIRYAPVISKATHFQIRLEDSQLLAPVQLVSLGFRVAGLTSKGIPEAADTTR